MGHFACDCIKAKKVLVHLNSYCNCLMLTNSSLANSTPLRIVNSCTINHLIKSQEGYIDYNRVWVARSVKIGRSSSMQVHGIGIYKLNLHGGHTLHFHDNFHTPEIRQNIFWSC